MIGNKHLEALFNYPDEDTSINQLLEILKTKDMEFIDSLSDPIDVKLCNDKEIEYLIKVSAIIDYCLQIQGLEVPDWLRDERLAFDKPYYHSKRLSDFEKFQLLYKSPSPFFARNVFFDLEGIGRV